MRGCSVAILVLNVLDDSVCQLKDKEGRSLDYSVTSGTVHRFLSLSLFLSPPFSLANTHTLSIFLALFFYFSLSHTQMHTYTHTHICPALWYAFHQSPVSFPGIERHLQVLWAPSQMQLKSPHFSHLLTAMTVMFDKCHHTGTLCINRWNSIHYFKSHLLQRMTLNIMFCNEWPGRKNRLCEEQNWSVL